MKEKMNMIKIQTWFEGTTVTFSIRSQGPMDCAYITSIAQLHLKQEGVDPLLSEVEWVSC